MSEDSFTEVTHESWFSRIGGAIKGILVGLILFIVAFPLLFWNEGRTVHRYKSLKEGGGAVVSVTSNSVNADNAGKLIHVTGKADTETILTDPIFEVSVNALKLNRTVEMYQWQQTTESRTEKETGGGTKTVKTYRYNKIWSDHKINSENFKRPSGHQNPGSIPYKQLRQTADKITLEAFVLPSSLVRKIQNFTPLPIASETPLPEELHGQATIYNDVFYMGEDPASPSIGDVRVAFEVIKPFQVSIIAKQVDNTFRPYQTEVGGNIELLQPGIHSADAMIKKAQESNIIMAWIFRLTGFILMLVGLIMILRPLSVLADVLPILGDIVGAGTGVISFLLATILSLITIGIAWVFYRPILGIALIVVAVGLTFGVKGKLKSAKVKASTQAV